MLTLREIPKSTWRVYRPLNLMRKLGVASAEGRGTPFGTIIRLTFSTVPRAGPNPPKPHCSTQNGTPWIQDRVAN